MSTGHLRAEPVQHSPEVAVDVDPVAEVGVHFGLGSADSPDDALMQLGDFEVEVLVEVEQGDVVQALGHVVDAAGVVGVHDFDRLALALLSVVAVDLGHAVAFGDLQALDCAVAVNAHGPDVDEVALGIMLHHGQQHVEGGLGVVGVSLVDGLQVLHRVGRRLELGQVDDGIGIEKFEGIEELLLLGGDVDLAEVDLLAGQLLPLRDPFFDGFDGTDARVPVFLVNFSSVKIIDNKDVIAKGRQLER